MRVLLAHNKYVGHSGEEEACQLIADVLERYGHSVSWFLRASDEIRGPADRVNAFFSGIHSPRSVRAIRERLQRSPPDLVQVQNLYPFLSPSILPEIKRLGFPLVMRCPNYRLFCINGLHLSGGEICERCLGGKEYWGFLKNCENSRLKSLGYTVRTAAARISGRILDNVDVFIVQSEFQKQRFIDQGVPAERLAIVPGVAPDIPPPPAPNDGGGEGETVGFVGRVSREKGIEDFLAAARALPHLPFEVAGDPRQAPNIADSAPPNVRWLGFLRGDDLDAFYRRIRVFVFPCRWFEGFPNVVLRAMMHARPVVATRIGALPEIVDDHRTGRLFALGRIDELVERIASLWDDPDARRDIGQAGRRKAQTEYSADRVYQSLLDCYRAAGADC